MQGALKESSKDNLKDVGCKRDTEVSGMEADGMSLVHAAKC